MSSFDYDIGIVGGGLAGLTAAIQLQKKGYSVVVLEKNKYPFHRVCGEYVSLESRDYLWSCGIDLAALGLPVINKLEISAPNGSLLKADLDMGGWGISRYLLDNLLFEEAKRLGVLILDHCRADDIAIDSQSYRVSAGTNRFRVRLALGSFGKRSSMDVKWKRNFVTQKPNALNNYIGVKYHIKTDFPSDIIALHNFRQGYCGISKIEADKYCLCYLTTASNLQACGGIREMEKHVLCANPHLRRLFEQSEFLFAEPVTISQISFSSKEVVCNGIALAGDACGMITPLCGNGMSMAMHSGKIFTGFADDYFQQRISRDAMLSCYEREWHRQFANRLRIGRLVQSNFGKEWQTRFFIGMMQKSPWLVRRIIQNTHGQVF